MKTIEIIGANYFGHWDKTRTACRVLIIKNGEILISYETKTDQYMIPGGGIENGETEKECCVREILEETGAVIEPFDCELEIDEYYEDFKWVNRYYFGKIIGSGERNLTKSEMEVGLEPRWVKLETMNDIFSKHNSYADTDEMRMGMYLREYTALCELGLN